MKTKLLLFLIMASLSSVKAQVSFGKACLGKWEGMMRMYQKGQLKDSVKILLTVAETQDPHLRSGCGKQNTYPPNIPQLKTIH